MEQAWELFRRGQHDTERYDNLRREAVRKNLGKLVTNGDITSGGTVTLPVNDVPEWRLEFDPNSQERTGTAKKDGQGQGRPQKGDVVGYHPRQGKGQQPGQGGDGEGDGGVFEVEIGVEDVAEAVFAGLELPRIQRKAPSQAFTEEMTMEDLRKKGSLLAKKETVIENIKRNSAKGEPWFHDVIDDDLRYRTPDVRRIPQDRVAVLFVRDRSGSMGEDEKRLTRHLAFWIRRFIQYKYQKVAESAFILFDSVAAEVNEEDFFHRSEGGGTIVSSGFRLAQEIIKERFNPSQYNLYIFAFSDGDNLEKDNPQVEALVRELLPDCNLIGYADITPGYQSPYSTNNGLRQVLEAIADPHLVAVQVRTGEDVPVAMQTFFGKRGAVT